MLPKQHAAETTRIFWLQQQGSRWLATFAVVLLGLAYVAIHVSKHVALCEGWWDFFLPALF
jgi:hypothetical protein